MTFPRLRRLTDAYLRRRGRELREAAIATHAPERLDECYPATVARVDAPALEKARWW